MAPKIPIPPPRWTSTIRSLAFSFRALGGASPANRIVIDGKTLAKPDRRTPSFRCDLGSSCRSKLQFPQTLAACHVLPPGRSR